MHVGLSGSRFQAERILSEGLLVVGAAAKRWRRLFRRMAMQPTEWERHGP